MFCININRIADNIIAIVLNINILHPVLALSSFALGSRARLASASAPSLAEAIVLQAFLHEFMDFYL